MATKYCEFEPTQHRNKRVASHVFLDEPGDPHPLAICDVCTKKLLQMRPGSIVMERKEFLALKKKGITPGAATEQPAEEPAAEAAAATEQPSE